MKLITSISVLTLATFLTMQSVAFADDDRVLVNIPADKQTQVLTEMRQLLDNIDDLIGALAEGDIKTVINITDFQMGFGHNRLQKMLKDGVPAEQIEKMRKKMMAQHGKGNGQGMGQGRGGMFGGGLGRFLPTDMRQMGQTMHAAAGELSATAKKIQGEPTASDYKAMLANLQDITSACRACHMSFKFR